MNTKICLPAENDITSSDYHRAVHRLRLAAADRSQSEARRQWIRAATQC